MKCSLLLSDCKQNYKASINFSKTVQRLIVLKPIEQSRGPYVRVDILKGTGEFLKITVTNTSNIIPRALEVSIVFDVVTNIFYVHFGVRHGGPEEGTVLNGPLATTEWGVFSLRRTELAFRCGRERGMFK